METLEAPYLLLAAPELQDPNFEHTVVLVGHHTLEGAIGWIVNRVLEEKATGLLPEPLARSLNERTPLRLGGPVLTNGLIVVHQSEVPGVESVQMAPGVRVSASPDVLPALFGKDQPDAGESGIVRGLLVFGYAGWGPGQLEKEMEDGSWLVLPYEVAFAFPRDAHALWERAMARLGVRPEAVASPPSSTVN